MSTAATHATVYTLNLTCDAKTAADALSAKRDLVKNIYKPEEFKRYENSSAQPSHAWLKNAALAQPDSQPLLVELSTHPSVEIRVGLQTPNKLTLLGEHRAADKPCIEVHCSFRRRNHWHGDQKYNSPFFASNGSTPKELTEFRKSFRYDDGIKDPVNGVIFWSMPLGSNLRFSGPDEADRYSFTVTSTLFFENSEGARRAVTFQQDPGMCTKP